MTEQDEAVRLLFPRLEALRDHGYEPMYNGRPSCPFCLNFIDDEETHTPGCLLVDALATPPPAASAPDAPDGLLPVRTRGKHEIEAAGGWVVACGAYSEYGCMPTKVRDYIVTVLNARLTAAPALDEYRQLARDVMDYCNDPKLVTQAARLTGQQED